MINNDAAAKIAATLSQIDMLESEIVRLIAQGNVARVGELETEIAGLHNHVQWQLDQVHGSVDAGAAAAPAAASSTASAPTFQMVVNQQLRAFAASNASIVADLSVTAATNGHLHDSRGNGALAIPFEVHERHGTNSVAIVLLYGAYEYSATVANATVDDVTSAVSVLFSVEPPGANGQPIISVFSAGVAALAVVPQLMAARPRVNLR